MPTEAVSRVGGASLAEDLSCRPFSFAFITVVGVTASRALALLNKICSLHHQQAQPVTIRAIVKARASAHGATVVASAKTVNDGGNQESSTVQKSGNKHSDGTTGIRNSRCASVRSKYCIRAATTKSEQSQHIKPYNNLAIKPNTFLFYSSCYAFLKLEP